MKDRIGNIGKIVSALFFIVILYMMFDDSRKYLSSRIRNRYTTKGIVVGVRLPMKYSGLNITYKYYYNNKEYTGMSTTDVAFNNNVNYSSKIVNKEFPVIVDTTNPESSDILICKVKFEKYNIPFPDSLNWTTKYFD